MTTLAPTLLGSSVLGTKIIFHGRGNEEENENGVIHLAVVSRPGQKEMGSQAGVQTCIQGSVATSIALCSGQLCPAPGSHSLMSIKLYLVWARGRELLNFRSHTQRRGGGCHQPLELQDVLTSYLHESQHTLPLL